MKQRNRLFGLSLVIAASILLLGGCSQGENKSSQSAGDAPGTAQTENNATQADPSSEEAAEIEHEPELAPSFELKSLDGDTVTLEDYKGQYVYINFWATWCQYCDEEMPDLMAFQKKHAEELTVLAINVNEKNDVVQKYIDKNKLDLKILMDSDGTVSQVYQVSAFPTTFLVDKAGKIIGYIPGKLSAEDMESTFKYLKEHETTK